MYHANQAYYNGQDSSYGEANTGIPWSQNNGATEGFNFNKFLQDQQHLLFPTTGFLPAGNGYLPFQGEPHYEQEAEEENEVMDYEDDQPEQEEWPHAEGPLSLPASLGFDGAVSRETYNPRPLSSNNQHTEAPQNDEYQPENPMITQVLRKPERQPKQTNIADKAAELRAKVLASRTNKQGTPNQEKNQELMSKHMAIEAGEAPRPAPVTRKRSVTDLDGLIAEERAAAETKAQQDSTLQAMTSGPTILAAKLPASSAEETHQEESAAASDGHADPERASGPQSNVALHEAAPLTLQKTTEVLQQYHDTYEKAPSSGTADLSRKGSAGGNSSGTLSSHKDKPLAARRQETVANGHPQLRSEVEMQK